MHRVGFKHRSRPDVLDIQGEQGLAVGVEVGRRGQANEFSARIAVHGHRRRVSFDHAARFHIGNNHPLTDISKDISIHVGYRSHILEFTPVGTLGDVFSAILKLTWNRGFA